MQEHPLAGGQESTWGPWQAGVHIHHRLNSLRLLLGVEIFGRGILLALLRRCSFCRRLPIHHRGGNLFPFAPLRAQVADSLSVPLVIPNQLKASVLQDELLAPWQSRDTNRRALAVGLPTCCLLLLFGRLNAS